MRDHICVSHLALWLRHVPSPEMLLGQLSWKAAVASENPVADYYIMKPL